MARAGTQRWRNPAPEGDDVQRSIELLDKVLSEYDEHDAESEGDGGGNGSGGGGGGSSSGSGGGGGCVGNRSGGGIGDCGSSTEPSIGLTPDDESPSLGHQSEDDGYMSMNGRKAKMALLALRPVPDCPEPQDPAGVSTQEFPPPPEEAERIISTFLPMVSSGNSSKKNVSQTSERQSNAGSRQQWIVAVEDSMRHGNAVTTQTTLPKTRHQRPYGWENGTVESLRLTQLPSPPNKFASLPYDVKVSFNWIPPRTNPSAVEKHREVRRRSSEECLEDEGGSHQSSSDRVSYYLRKHHRQQNEIMKSSSVEDRLLMNRSDKESMRRTRNDSDSSEGRFSRNSESESRSSIARSSSVSVERFSMRANCDSSDFSRANSTSNERFHSDFSIAVASASSNDHVSVPTSEPFSIRNLDFVSFALPHMDSSERFSAPTSEERYSDLFSTRNSDFSARNSADFRTQSEEERFSDDSLEELLPPPPPISKRHSIAWEVSLEDDPLYAPGSTKVVGRRRRKSSDVSSVGSVSKLRDFDDWQDQRLSTTDDDLISPYSDSSTNDLDQIQPQELTKNGTYVIRRGRKKERKVLPKTPTKTKSLSFENGEKDSRLSDVKRYSSTFDNIKSLLKEGKLESLDEPVKFMIPVPPPDLIRVESMPAINNDASNRAQLDITVEEEEASDISDKDKERDNIEFSRLPLLPVEDDQMNRLDQSRDCNGSTVSNLADLDIGRLSANSALAEAMTKKKLTSAVSDERLASKIPVNLLIEDQIVKKALKENRRQLEKVSDAIKEIENVKNSESYCESKLWQNGDLKHNSKRNSFENDGFPVYDSRKPVTIDGSPYDSRTRDRKQQKQQKQQQQQQYNSDSETSKTSSDADFEDRRKLNGATDVVYSSGRRLRQNGIENHKNDQKQIENVIDAILEDSKNSEFQVNVDVMEFPPLPPSPVEEADEESCSDVGQNAVMTPLKSKGHSSRTVEYRPRVPPHRVPSIIDAKDKASLNTRSMDAGFTKGRRTPTTNNSRREVPVERRTLPTDLPGPSRRRPFTKRHSPSAEACSSGSSNNGSGLHTGSSVVISTGSGMQTSCSLPETPVFARGSDIPRTPQHAGNPTQSRRQPGWYAPTTATGYRRNNPGLEQAIIGTELLRLAGGPNRGWYPTRKANQPRPASIEHLERLNNAYDARLPGTGDQRKPLTLPTNITPNKYFGQRSGGKDGKGSKDSNLSSGPYAGCADSGDAPKKKSFFKGFWKRSRHYSLENQ
ncbi:PREDICTED: uncharacterized protein LOC108693260 isoform X2 [Atta colombica]|uniref:uncharacterized protein LOC108693260 isoform X2 n=1 Tax=Atta colombica TaxID=520822 RepID=UPI00084CAEF8|nr:PREDICTED: uncharacterized protein LOC108693260 isoform X2 [Atta colombica]